MSLPPGSARFARPCVSPDDAPRVAQLLSIPVFHTSLLTISAMLVCSISGHGHGKHGQVGHHAVGGFVQEKSNVSLPRSLPGFGSSGR